MKIIWCLALTIIVTISIASCAAAGMQETTPAASNPTTSPPPPTTPADDGAALVNGNTDFAFDLYHELKGTDGNLFYSPYSISAALAMTYGGARGDTAQQMADVLHFMLPPERLNPTFSELDNTLKERSQDIEVPVWDEGAEPTTEKIDGFRLNIVNALWGQEGYHFLADYLEMIETYYDGGFNIVNFAEEPEQARETINEWASEQTEGRINDLLPPGVIDILTRLVITNAIYFNAHWQHEFSEELTADADFYLLDGSKVTAPMMQQEEMFRYGEGGTYQAVSLPYLGGELEMVILLPGEGKFNEFEDSLDTAVLNRIIAEMESKQVDLSLPKFEFSCDYGLAETLQEMGMTDAFTWSAADFSGIDGTQELFIDDVIHKTFVSVDEKGTEAAAVTAVEMSLVSMPLEPVEFRADRPFVFIIRDIGTGAVLFVGRVMDPTA